MLNFLQEVNPGIDYTIDEYTAGDLSPVRVFEREMVLFGFGTAAKKENGEEINSQLFVDNNYGKFFCFVIENNNQELPQLMVYDVRKVFP